VQGREEDAAARLAADAQALEAAGVFAMVLELVPAAVAGRITQTVSVPTIGIGAGPQCDGQVLVLHDMLGLNQHLNPKFLKHYANLADQVRDAVRCYSEEVRSGTYPDSAHSF
jgi:3-methyl-2-oxobutanoate hydroxymethyltransferase